MSKYLSSIIDTVLRAIYETSKYIIFMIIIMLFIIQGDFDFKIDECNKVFIGGILLYSIVYLVYSLLLNSKLKSVIKNLIISLIMIISPFLPMIFMKRNFDFYSFCVCIIYFVITVRSLIYTVDGIDIQPQITKFAMILGAMMITLVFTERIFYNPDIQESNTLIVRYIAIYIVAGLMHIARVNLMEEYCKVNSISINKNKNIWRVNLISLAIILGSTALMAADSTKKYMSIFMDKVGYLLYIIFYGIMMCVDKVIGFDALKKEIERRNHYKEVEESMKKSSEQAKETTEEAKNIIEYIQKSEYGKTLKIIAFVVFVIAIVLIIYFVCKKLNKRKKVNFTDSEEEKEFIFNLKDLKNKALNLGKLVNKGIENMRLHPIRKVYIQLVVNLNKKGVKYNKCYTPTEYNSVIEKSEFRGKEINKVINLYNKLRYGNKTITKEEINMAYKIKDSL